MMDKHATPLRSLAAYAQSIRILHGSRYGATWKWPTRQFNGPGFFPQRAIVMHREDSVAVYTGRRDPQARVKLNVPVVCLEGIDGRLLSPVADEISVPDGLAYASAFPRRKRIASGVTGFDASHPTSHVAPWRQSPAGVAHAFDPDRHGRDLFDGGLVEPNAEGYRIKAAPAGKMPVGCGSSICPTRGGGCGCRLTGSQPRVL